MHLRIESEGKIVNLGFELCLEKNKILLMWLLD